MILRKETETRDSMLLHCLPKYSHIRMNDTPQGDGNDIEVLSINTFKTCNR